MSSATARGFVAHTADGAALSRRRSCWCACGAWSNRMAEPFGEAVPMEARGPQMGVTEPLPYAIGPSIGVSSPIEHEGLYFRQIRARQHRLRRRAQGPGACRCASAPT